MTDADDRLCFSVIKGKHVMGFNILIESNVSENMPFYGKIM